MGLCFLIGCFPLLYPQCTGTTPVHPHAAQSRHRHILLCSAAHRPLQDGTRTLQSEFVCLCRLFGDKRPRPFSKTTAYRGEFFFFFKFRHLFGTFINDSWRLFNHLQLSSLSLARDIFLLYCNVHILPVGVSTDRPTNELP